jgi:hypothetical protein
MKKSKKLTLETTTMRRLNDELHGVAGAMSANVRCTQSGCASYACTGRVMGCDRTDFVMCG